MQHHLAILLLSLTSICHAANVISIETTSGNPITTARVNGVPLQLVIDSGGGLLSLKSSAIEKVSAIPAKTKRSGTDALGTTTTSEMFAIASLELGNMTFTRIEADQISGYGEGSPGDGVIGRRLLNQFIAVYDYASSRITLYASRERRAAKRACHGTEINTVPDEDGVIVSVATSDHQSMRILWDTGATYSFVKKSFADEHALPLQGQFYTTQRFDLGKQDFGPLQFVVLDLKAPVNVDGYIGRNFFSNHVVCIDPSKQKVTVRNN